MVSLLSEVGTGIGSLAQGFAGGVGEGAGLTGLATKFGAKAGVTGGWADVGRQIGQIYGQTQSANPLATTLRTWESFQQSPTYKNLLMQFASKGTKTKTKRPPRYLAEGEREQGAGWGQADIGE